MLLVAAPASAQQDKESASSNVEVTGVIEKPEITSYSYGSHAVNDESSGERYALRSEEEGLLDDSTGRRATVSGTLVPGYENGAVEGGPPLVEVDEVRSAAGASSRANGADVNGDGAVDEADGEFAAAVSDAARAESEKAEGTVLPATGGPVLALLGLALVLLGIVLPVYRVLR